MPAISSGEQAVAGMLFSGRRGENLRPQLQGVRESLEFITVSHQSPASINQAAARSLEEGFEETLTVNRLGVSEQLRRLFSSTNIIESCFSLADDLCHNVKRWRDANMAWRWAGTVLLEVEKRFHRVKGYRDLPLLIEKSQQVVDCEEAVA